MKNKLLKAGILAFALITGNAIQAQDLWTNSAMNGFGYQNNTTVHGMNIFNSELYAATGSDSGYVYKSSTGHPNSWTKVFSDPISISVDAITSTTVGGGNLYIASGSNWPDTSRVMRSTNGTTWSTYFMTSGRVNFITPFKGSGSVDSIYVFEDNGLVQKSFYNSNDPLNIAGSWDTVFNLNLFSPSAITTIFNGGTALYLGTSSAELFKTTDGNNWVKNTFVGNGFGDGSNKGISAIGYFGGQIYIATNNNTLGSQLWRSSDEITWTMVQQFPNNFSKVTSMNVANGKLWLTLYNNFGPGQVLNTSDGISFYTSNSNGFGNVSISGNAASTIQFGNNIYWGGENYGFGGKAAGSNFGAQIWRTCTATPPSLNLGADQTVCLGTSVTLNAGPGAVAYLWNDGSTAQTNSVTAPGIFSVQYIGSNGCSAMDTMVLSTSIGPTVTVSNPVLGSPIDICSGTSTTVTGTAISNRYIPDPPIHKITNDSISDTLPAVMDSISVSGLTSACSCDALMSVTIDSMYHTYIGDLNLIIHAPDGSSTFLSQQHGGSEDNFFGTTFIMNAGQQITTATPPFIGSFYPEGDFHALTGNPNGAWALEVMDLAGGDDGKLKGWTIRFKADDTVISYSWSPAAGVTSLSTLNTVLTPSVSTTYTLTATNSSGCSSQTLVDFNVAHLTFAQRADTACYGKSIDITVDGGTANTLWSPSTDLNTTYGPTVTSTLSSSIHYYVTDTIFGCPVKDSIYIYENGQMFLNSPSPVGICNNDTAMLGASASGGSAPYIYKWDAGGTYLYGDTIRPVLTSGTSYTITATDAAGCYANGGTSVSVMPSTDVYGHVSYSGGTVNGSNVVLYKYYPFLTQFDTSQVTTTDASGNFYFPAVDHNNYIIEVYPDPSYTTLVPTYYGNQYLWDSATVLAHDCSMNDTLNITAVEYLPVTGPGSLQGVILEGPGYTGGFMSINGGQIRIPGEPIPGIDVKLGRNPGGALVTSTITDGTGNYSFNGVPLNNAGEHYTIYVDIPGLGRDSSYNVTLDATNNQFVNLDYYVDSTVVYIVDNVTTEITDNNNINKAKTESFDIYPNPSKGNATITYTIAEEGKVSLSVYDLLGVKVADLVNDEKPAGIYHYSLSEKDSGLSNGVYFISMVTKGKKETHRLVISK